MAGPKSWCDKLASVPSVGLKLVPHYASSDTLFDAVSPILDRSVKGDQATFHVTQQTSFEIQFQTDEGFHYLLEPTKCAISFRHRMRPKLQSAGPPVMELLSHPLPYTALLQDASDRLVEVAPRLPGGAKARAMTRVGVLSTTTVDMAEAPPGILRFLDYVGRPWRTSLNYFDMAVMADLSKTKEWDDRCIHTLKKSEEPDAMLSITLDWQRVYHSERLLKPELLRPLLANCREAALNYFEDVAQGNRFDEKLISEAAGV
jgi:hypothetical protein